MKIDVEDVLKIYRRVATPCPECGSHRSLLNREDGSSSYLYCWKCKKPSQVA